MRKVRNSTKSGSSSSSSSGKNSNKGQQQQQQQPPADWDENAEGNSPRSDGGGTDNNKSGDREIISDKSMAGMQSKNYKLAKELVRCCACVLLFSLLSNVLLIG